MDLAISGPSQSGGRMRKSETIVREIKRRLEKRRKDRKLEVMCKKKLLKRLKDGDDSQYREELKELNNQINDINNKVMDARENQTQARQSRLSKISITANLLYQYEDVKENEKRTKTRLDSCMKDLETVRSKINARQDKVRQDLAKFEEDLQQVEAAEENIRLQRQQSRDTMDRHEQNLRAASDRLNNLCNQKKKVEFEIQVISKSDSNLAVYGSTIVRIVEEINKQQNQFCQKPIGPLGLYIKVKDQNETAAVVNFLDESMLSAFCVDNDEDFVVLNNILKAVCQDDQQPTIYCSKFLPQKHKIEGHETETNHFMNLASMLEIDNPVVFNCLVDQLDDHTTLSIPPNEEEEYPLFEDEHQEFGRRICKTERRRGFQARGGEKCSRRNQERVRLLKQNRSDCTPVEGEEVPVVDRDRLAERHDRS